METLLQAQLICWDFDGVIKDSVTVKSEAFEQLFLPYGRDIAKRVRRHHETHGGVSRYDKMPLYLEWAGEPSNKVMLEEYCEKFSRLVLQSVIDSAWVPGVLQYLQSHYTHQQFILMTATPQEEIQTILRSLDIAHFFCEVHGAPKPKTEIIRDVLRRLKCTPDKALAIGDSESDLKAAEANHVVFMLRRTSLNQKLQESYSGPMFDDLNHE